MSPNGSPSHCSNALQVWQIAYNKRINTRWDTNMPAVSLRSDYSRYVCAPYLGVKPTGKYYYQTHVRVMDISQLKVMGEHA